MPSTAEQVKNIILKHNGARKQQIARELNLGLDYVDFACHDLARKGEIAFRDGSYSVVAPTSGKKAQNRIKPSTDKQGVFIQDIHAASVLLGIPKMTESLINILEKAGYRTIESLADAPIARLMQETKLQLHEAAGLINQARKVLNKIRE
ncbi:MAG: hypothetical protein Q8P35_02405 [Candidatus Yanofskybacteria bacterium]|nr:hypothetical protein [Candidatus Yanofskybacteria bacterium]